jgi:hypothetical protein
VIVHAFSDATERVRGCTFLRAIVNVGLGCGAALAVIPLELNTRLAYASVITADAISFLAAAALLSKVRITDAPHKEVGQDRRRASSKQPNVLSDTRYLVVTFLYGILSIQYGILQIGIPLWVVRYTAAPRWVISGVLVLNTVLVIVFQVKASRGTENPVRAARLCVVSGICLGLGCVIYSASGFFAVTMCIVMPLAGTVAITFGEIFSSSGAWALSYSLADPSAHGRYQGFFNSGFSGGMLFSGAVLTSTAIRFGAVGWVMLAVLFVAAGTGFVPVGRERKYRTA